MAAGERVREAKEVTAHVLLAVSQGIANLDECCNLASALGFGKVYINKLSSSSFQDAGTARDILFNWCSSLGKKATGVLLYKALHKIKRADLADCYERELLDEGDSLSAAESADSGQQLPAETSLPPEAEYSSSAASSAEWQTGLISSTPLVSEKIHAVVSHAHASLADINAPDDKQPSTPLFSKGSLHPDPSLTGDSISNPTPEQYHHGKKRIDTCVPFMPEENSASLAVDFKKKPPAVMNKVTPELSVKCDAEYREYAISEEATCWAIVTVQASSYASNVRRAPLNLVVVIDKSGSMEGDKMDMVKVTLEFIIRQMSSGDRLGLVLYDFEVTVPFPHMLHMDEEGKSVMLNQVQQIFPGNATNLSGGLTRGLMMIEDHHATTALSDAVSSVFLITDGQANAGYTEMGKIVACLTAKGRATLPPAPGRPTPITTNLQSDRTRPAGEPVTSKPAAAVYTFGFGVDHNAELLQAISEAANGMYYFIDSAEKIPPSFADCLGGLLSSVAENTTTSLTACNGACIVSVSSGCENRGSDSTPIGSTCTLPLGDIQSEERRDTLVKLRLPKLDSEQMEWPVLQAKLSYFNVITSTMEMKEAQLTVSRPSTERGGLVRSDDVVIQQSRLAAVKAMKQATTSAATGNFQQAGEILNKALDTIDFNSTPGAVLSPCVREIKNDVKELQAIMSSPPLAWSEGGHHRFISTQQKHAMQRSNAPQLSAYSTEQRLHCIVKSPNPLGIPLQPQHSNVPHQSAFLTNLQDFISVFPGEMPVPVPQQPQHSDAAFCSTSFSLPEQRRNSS